MKGQPFFFDTNNFDDDGASKVEEEPPEEPEFTQTQMNEAKALAHAEGKKEGHKESQDSIEQQSLALLQKLDLDIQKLNIEEKKRSALFENEAVHLSLKIMEKLFPALEEQFSGAELEAAIISALSNQKTPDKVTIKLHETMEEQIQSAIKKSDVDLNAITLSAQTNFSKAQTQILWDGGGLIYNHNIIAQKTFEIIKDTLAERGITVHDEENSQSDNDAPSEKNTADTEIIEQETTK